jgi:hypothetical protein
MNVEHWWNNTDTGKSKFSGAEPCPNANLSTTHHKRVGLGSNPGFRDTKPKANHVSHGNTQVSFGYRQFF